MFPWLTLIVLNPANAAIHRCKPPLSFMTIIYWLGFKILKNVLHPDIKDRLKGMLLGYIHTSRCNNYICINWAIRISGAP